jgi:hypothetical protein
MLRHVKFPLGASEKNCTSHDATSKESATVLHKESATVLYKFAEASAWIQSSINTSSIASNRALIEGRHQVARFHQLQLL